jgi:hypothetical protein
MVAALGLILFARIGIGGTYWFTFFPAVVVLGLGMAVVVAPLTTTVMAAVEAEHAGVASGVNNAVARVAGLLAVAVLGIVLVASFEARVGEALDRVQLTATERTSIEAELPKLAGADVDAAIPAAKRAASRRAIDESFVSAFRVVMITAAIVALGAGVAGAFVR